MSRIMRKPMFWFQTWSNTNQAVQLQKMARFVTRNYSHETGSMTGIHEELKWETLQKRRKDNRLILLYKGLKGKATIPTDDLIPKNRRCRNQHSLVFQIPTASKDAYKKSFFPQAIRDWNVLPDYTPSIYADGYIVFAFPFVRSYVRSYFRHVCGICVKVLRLSFSSGVYLSNYPSESIHIWTIVTLEGWHSLHDHGPQGPCPDWGQRSKSRTP